MLGLFYLLLLARAGVSPGVSLLSEADMVCDSSAHSADLGPPSADRQTLLLPRTCRTCCFCSCPKDVWKRLETDSSSDPIAHRCADKDAVSRFAVQFTIFRRHLRLLARVAYPDRPWEHVAALDGGRSRCLEFQTLGATRQLVPLHSHSTSSCCLLAHSLTSTFIFSCA